MGTLWGMMLLATLSSFEGELANEQSIQDGEGAAVVAQVTGNTLVGLDIQLQQFRVFYAADGTTRRQQGSRLDSGKWWVDAQGRVCDRWLRLRRGEARCYRWEADDGHIIYYDGAGRLRAHAQLLAGNPFRL